MQKKAINGSVGAKSDISKSLKKMIGGGGGYRLGGESAGSGEASTSSTSAAPRAKGKSKSNTNAAKPQKVQEIPDVVVDPALPTTEVRVRRANRSEVIRLNTHHTVGDVRNALLMIGGPNLQADPRNWVLETVYPTRVLDDPTVSLQDANLLNSLLIQRFT